MAYIWPTCALCPRAAQSILRAKTLSATPKRGHQLAAQVASAGSSSDKQTKSCLRGQQAGLCMLNWSLESESGCLANQNTANQLVFSGRRRRW